MEIGQKIRRRRNEKGLSLRALGATVGVSGNAVHLWEIGAVAQITVAHRIKLSEALDMPLADLLPPGAGGSDVTIRDPQQILLIEKFRELPPPLREAYLRLLVAQVGDPPQTS